jgi:hypothetical protein
VESQTPPEVSSIMPVMPASTRVGALPQMTVSEPENQAQLPAGTNPHAATARWSKGSNVQWVHVGHRL